jgi:excisionase family DNA binding protein
VGEEFLIRTEAADYLRVPVATLAAWAYRHTGPQFYRVGRRVLYRRAELDRWIEDQKVNPSA